MKIVIIGAGVAGLAIGWRLVQAGAQVTVLERGQPGAGATAASAGMIAVTAELADAQVPEIEFAHYSNRLWPDFAAQIEAESGRTIGFSRSGALILAEDAAAVSRLARQQGGVLVDVPQARALAPLLTGDFAGAFWAEHEAHVDSRALGSALAIVFRKAGGKLLTNEAVVRIERDGSSPAVRTPFGLYPADRILLAAGAWSGMIEDTPIAPVKGQMIALAPPPGLALPGPVLWGHGVYAVPRGLHLLVGATVEEAGFDTRPTREGRDYLRARVARLIPASKNWTLADHWAGLRPRSPDGLPLLGPSKIEGLWLAGGQYRNGILFAPAIAQTMCDQLLDRAAPIAAFDPRRFA